jgi:hypothetical protein
MLLSLVIPLLAIGASCLDETEERCRSARRIV